MKMITTKPLSFFFKFWANEIQLCKVSCEAGVSSEPLKVSHSIIVMIGHGVFISMEKRFPLKIHLSHRSQLYYQQNPYKI